MTHLIYVRTIRGLSPQKVFDDVGGKPFLDAGIRDLVEAQHPLPAEHEGLPLDEMASLYPAPIVEREVRP